MALYYSGQTGSSAITFHAMRRTRDGLLYYTRINSATDSDEIDLQRYYDPTVDLPPDEYVEEEIVLQETLDEYTGDGSSTTFILPRTADQQRVYIWLNGVLQEAGRDFTVTGTTLEFSVPPFNNSQIAVRYFSKKYYNNESDKYQQYRTEQGDAFYYLNLEGFLLKHIGFYQSQNVESGAGANSFELYDGDALIARTTYAEDYSKGFDQDDITFDSDAYTFDMT